MSRVVLFNKPFGVLSQFLPMGERRGLREFVPVSGVYAAGRLDAESEGLLVLTDDGPLQGWITDPRFKMEKAYWAQVEGLPSEAALLRLAGGVELGDFATLPCQVRIVREPPELWPRVPPIRARRHIPTAWLEIRLTQGKNRQVRRMTAAVGFPTLRLIRWAVGPWMLDGLRPGEWMELIDRKAALQSICTPRKLP